MRERPNIIHIHTDSMDGRVIGCAGHRAAHTPNLDRMASEGTVFLNAYSNNPICCPSRASMRSGLYTHNCEAWNNHKGLERDTPTYDTFLERSGYRVKTIGRTDYLSGKHTVRARVDAWTRTARIERPAYNEPPPTVLDEDNPRVAATDWKRVDQAVDWLRENAGTPADGPFKLYVGFGAPHPPFVTSRTYLDLIDEANVTLPPLEEPSHPVARYQSVHKNWPYGFDEDTVLKVRRIYYAMVAEVDAMAGRLLDAISESGLNDSTLVLFSSDHGELAMEHRQYYKMSPYEGSVRVPLIAAGAGVVAGARVERPASLLDIFPTFVDLAGVEHPYPLDGFSLKADLEGAASEHPDWVVSEFHDCTSNATWFMLRQGDWKYIGYMGYQPEMFNLLEDPDEATNVAAENPGRASEMHQLLESVVDTAEVNARVLAYDKKSFREWRERELARGTYRESMATIFSGFDNMKSEDIRPWTDEDEARIVDWLEGGVS